MNREQITQIIEARVAELFQTHNVRYWEIDWEVQLPARTLGLCNYRMQTLSFNLDIMVNLSQETILNTVNHEVAHALAGDRAGHGPIWRQWAVICGADPKATCILPDEAAKLTYKWEICYLADDGTTVRTGGYGNRRTKLDGKQLIGKPHTKNKLFWAEVAR